MRPRTIVVGSLVVCVFASFATPEVAHAQLQALQALADGPECEAVDINTQQTVVGTCIGTPASGGQPTAVVWAAGQSEVMPLPVLVAGEFCTPIAISDAGVVAGMCGDAEEDAVAVRWTPGADGRFMTPPTVLRPLSALLGLAADVVATVSSINAAGVVIGASVSASGRSRAVLWDAGSPVPTYLPDPPVGLGRTLWGCLPVAVNDRPAPTVVGSCVIEAQDVVSVLPIRWQRHGGYGYAATRLGDGGGYHCAPTDINDQDVTIGSCEDADGNFDAIVWRPTETAALRILAPEAARFSVATAINHAGLVTGTFMDANGYSRVFVGNPLSAPTITDIGTLPGGRSCTAIGIGAAGTVAANCDTADHMSEASFYDPQQGLVSLGTPGGFASTIRTYPRRSTTAAAAVGVTADHQQQAFRAAAPVATLGARRASPTMAPAATLPVGLGAALEGPITTILSSVTMTQYLTVMGVLGDLDTSLGTDARHSLSTSLVAELRPLYTAIESSVQKMRKNRRPTSAITNRTFVLANAFFTTDRVKTILTRVKGTLTTREWEAVRSAFANVFLWSRYGL